MIFLKLKKKKIKILVKIREMLSHYFVILVTLCQCMLCILVYNSKCVSWKKYQFSWIMKYLGVVVWQLWWNPVLEEKNDYFIVFLVIIERLVIMMKLWTLAFFQKQKILMLGRHKVDSKFGTNSKKNFKIRGSVSASLKFLPHP